MPGALVLTVLSLPLCRLGTPITRGGSFSFSAVFEYILTFHRATREKTSKMVSNIRVHVGIERYPGSASRELVLSHFDQFLTFGRAGVKKRRKRFSRIRTRASAVPEEKWFVRPKSTWLASISALHFIPVASRELVLSHFDQFLTFCRAGSQKRWEWFSRIRTRASAVPEETWFDRPESTLLASISALHFIPVAHHASSFSAISTIF